MRVLLDVDGVIADFTGKVLSEIERILGRYYEPHQVTQWSIKDALGLSDRDWKRVVDEVICREGFAYFLDPYPGAVAAVKELAADHVYFVTSPWHSSETWCHDRTEWLCKHFGQAQGRKVIHTGHKHLVDGDVLVDDKPETVFEWARVNVRRVGVLWDRPYNQRSGLRLRTNDWDRLRQIIEQ
jgi:5'(3')-deoxyribonucleotidase